MGSRSSSVPMGKQRTCRKRVAVGETNLRKVTLIERNDSGWGARKDVGGFWKGGRRLGL